MDNENEDAGKTLSLSGLQSALAEKGIKVALSGLSALLNEGEGDDQIAVQLGVRRAGNKLVIPEIACDVIVGWWPLFQSAGGRKPKAPALLRRYLDHLRSNALGESLSPTFSLSETQNVITDSQITPALERVVVALEALHRAVAYDDTLLSADAVMQILSMRSTACVHHLRVKVGRASRWRKSDINVYIAALGIKECVP